MKKVGFILFTLFFCMYMSTGVIFAQANLELAVGKASGQTITPTPTPKANQPTGDPTPATTQAPIPTTQATVVPTQPAKDSDPTTAPAQLQQVEKSEPTATPTPVPPTPTSKPKPLALITNQKPPAQPIAQIISAPFDLVMNSLPQNYYSDQGLTPATNRALLAAAGLSLLGGTVLLTWPSLIKFKKRMYAHALRERRSYPYIAGRA